MNKNVYAFKIKLLGNSLSPFLIFAGFLFKGFKHMTKHHLKHSLFKF